MKAFSSANYSCQCSSKRIYATGPFLLERRHMYFVNIIKVLTSSWLQECCILWSESWEYLATFGTKLRTTILTLLFFFDTLQHLRVSICCRVTYSSRGLFLNYSLKCGCTYFYFLWSLSKFCFFNHACTKNVHWAQCSLTHFYLEVRNMLLVNMFLTSTFFFLLRKQNYFLHVLNIKRKKTLHKTSDSEKLILCLWFYESENLMRNVPDTVNFVT